MIYRSERMTLVAVMDAYHGDVNDVIICEDERAKGAYYTVLKITDHNTVKKLLAVLEKYPDKRDCVIDMSSCEDGFLVVMDYCRVRPLLEFFETGAQSKERAERISLHLVAACIGSKLPYPLLELALKGYQVHLRQDDSVDIGCVLDLKQLDLASDERACANACARIVRELLDQVPERRMVSLQLLNKKLPLQNYYTFRELYQDLHISAEGSPRRGLLGRIRSWILRNQESIFRVLLWISVLLMILVVLMALSNVVFGDIPFMRLFFNSFRRIGTESMLQ